MAEFKGKMRLHEEKSELEINGRFALTEEELNMVVGGSSIKSPEKINSDLVRKLLEIIFTPLSDESAGTGGDQ